MVRQVGMEAFPNPIPGINHLVGPLSTDLFASRSSSQLPVFVSWRPDPLAAATDAFTQDWNTLPE